MRTPKQGDELQAPVIPDYDLLRPIGRGSYGDVWLARGLTGVYRAIKLVWRDRFPDAEPFEREFKGLKKFMAMSLPDAGQLSLLHVGQNETAGFFYYVMELADDAERGREIDPARYVPLTLTEVRRRKGRLPAKECVAIGTELARALAGLHSRGLVHRDIKPSNVILVGGVPKLADIGLVASTADAQTYVGTQGFVPPEGPGKPAADVFALGRLLYELATGLDREEFPRLPPELNQVPDRKVLFELNEVILHACEADVKQRCADGAAMLTDLQLLQAGSSVRARKRWRGAGVAALVLVVAGAGGWWKTHSPPPTPPAMSPAMAGRSIAVLPFANYSDDKQNGYFADGVYDDVLTNLANIGALRVISRTSMVQYRDTTKTVRQIAAELGVAYILEGSVRRAGNKVRVTGQLIRAATDEPVWASTYDRDLTDVFAIQSEVAHAIAAALNGALSPQDESRLGRRPTTNMAAYDLYQRGRALERGSFIDRDTIRKELALYEQAVELDPKYAEAWAAISGASMMLTDDAFAGASAAQIAKAKAALVRAQQLDPDNFIVLMAAASFGVMTGDRAMVNRNRQRVIELFPNRAEARYVAGLTASHEGRAEDALAAFREAHALDPHNADILGNMEDLLLSLRRYDEYAAILQLHRALQPEQLALAFQQALVPLRQNGSTADLRTFLANLPPDPDHANTALTSYRAQALFMMGDAAEFVRLWREAGPRWKFDEAGVFDDISVAMALLALHDPAAARPLLVRTRDHCLAVIKKNPTIIPRWNLLGLCQALLGEPEAKATLAHVRELLRADKEYADAIPTVMFYNSLWRPWAGEKAEAVAEIGRRLKEGVSTIHAYAHELRHSIFTLPLHGDPAFEAMLDDPASNAPVHPEVRRGN